MRRSGGTLGCSQHIEVQNFIMRAFRAIAIKTALTFTVLLLVGCSAVRLGYNHGESLTYWWLNRYIDVGADQQAGVKKDIEKLFAWHRQTQLQDYVQLLKLVQKQVQHNVSAPEVLADYDELKKRAVLVVDQALPDLADLALALRPQQIARLEKKFAANNDDYRKDYLRGDLEQRQRFRFKKVMEQAEYWFGDFSREQEALIRRASDARPLDNGLWLADRMHRQREMIAVLKKIQTQKPNRDAAMLLLKDYAVLVFERTGMTEHEPFFNASKEGMASMAAVIVNSATPAQKTHAIRTLQQWIDNFNTLAAESA